MKIFEMISNIFKKKSNTCHFFLHLTVNTLHLTSKKHFSPLMVAGVLGCIQVLDFDTQTRRSTKTPCPTCLWNGMEYEIWNILTLLEFLEWSQILRMELHSSQLQNNRIFGVILWWSIGASVQKIPQSKFKELAKKLLTHLSLSNYFNTP